jgi:hypothetical protein
MPDFLNSAFPPAPHFSPVDVSLRLLVALALGMVIAWIYRIARGPGAAGGSFPGTLILLAVLIAMVTQVIGDNVARAFSLVGALSIVRFRTVVRDTQDTAYVILAVVVGMSVGANAPWVALLGLAVVGLAAWLLCRPADLAAASSDLWQLSVRVGLGIDHEALIGPALGTALLSRRLLSVETARQGVALDLVYEARLRPGAAADAVVKSLSRIEGVQGVTLHRRDFEPA